MPYIACTFVMLPMLFMFGQLTIFSGIVSFLTAWLSSRVVLFFYTLYLQRKIYGSDISSLVSDMNMQTKEDQTQSSSNSRVKTINITIIDKPEESRSTYKDEPIFEWLIIKIEEEEPKRYEYDGIVDLDSENVTLSKGSIIIWPGIIYRQTDEQ